MTQLMPLSLTLASVKSRLVLLFWFWCRLTWVVPDKGPLNVCVCVFVDIFLMSFIQHFADFLVCDVVFYHRADFFKSIPISEVQNDIKFHSYSFRNDNQFLKVENEANESNRESNFHKSFDNPS